MQKQWDVFTFIVLIFSRVVNTQNEKFALFETKILRFFIKFGIMEQKG